MERYAKLDDIEALITACEWRMTLAKERNGEGFVDYSKQVLDADELNERLADLPTIKVSKDCISRDDAINALISHFIPQTYTGEEVEQASKLARKIMANAPSVVPLCEECGNCEFRDEDFDEALQSVAYEHGYEDGWNSRGEGEWIISEDGDSFCSECGASEEEFIFGTENWYGIGISNYCPNCGKKMKGAE